MVDVCESPDFVNGCEVLEAKRIEDGWLVLVLGWNDYTPYVTWCVDFGLNAYWGRYFSDFESALANFRDRY